MAEVPFSIFSSVFNTAGVSVAKGLVDGQAIELPQGEYRVLVRTEPRQIFDKVVVPGEQAVQLSLKPGE